MTTRISVHDMNRTKLCEQYDSELSCAGQAYDISLTTEISGWKELTFVLPQTIDGRRNFRWDYVRSGYLVRVDRDGEKDWYLLNAPKRSHKGQKISATLTCQHVCALLSKKNLYLTFDDTNGIGTAEHLLRQAQANTGWTLGYCETFYEADGVTEKVRSLKSDNKRGAYLLISDICALFAARPVYNGEERSVSVYSLNRHEEMLELNFGKNLESIDRKEDAENIVTRQYVEGEYSDTGYVSIDDVNPTGLPFLLNFDYFREQGVFTAAHEQALSDYLRDIQLVKQDSAQTMQRLIGQENQLNALWGQIDYVLYQIRDRSVIRIIRGGKATEEQAIIQSDDKITVLVSDGTHREQTGGVFEKDVVFAIKFVLKASARIGGKEVAVEAKRASIDSLYRQLDDVEDASKRQDILDRIAALENEIEEIYRGNENEDGLYILMRRAAATAVDYDDFTALYEAALSGQSAIEEQFARAMGDMLIDGYWSNTNYAVGQEEFLYREACEIMTQLARPSVTYAATIRNLSGISGYERERFRIAAQLRIWDEQLPLNDKAYVTKLVEHPEQPEKDSITIANDLTRIGGVSLDGIIRRISGIAEILHQKEALYDRSRAISENGSIPAQRLEGMIDVLRTRLSSSISNWYTDGDGNLILESVNGRGAMKLCGEGFMIAGGRTDNGAWDWRTFGSGEGFTADLLVTGFLSADRIQAGTITASKLSSDVGQTLDLSSNESIHSTVTRVVDHAVGYRVELYSEQGDVLSDVVRTTTIRARVWRGGTEITDNLLDAQFNWTRNSSDETADRLWNAAHRGMKCITLTTADVLYCVTYSCEISEV